MVLAVDENLEVFFEKFNKLEDELKEERNAKEKIQNDFKNLKAQLDKKEKADIEFQEEVRSALRQFVAAEQGVNRAITNSCNEQARMRKKNREGFEDTQQMVLLKGEDVIEEVQYLSTAVNKLQALLICQDDQIQR